MNTAAHTAYAPTHHYSAHNFFPLVLLGLLSQTLFTGLSGMRSAWNLNIVFTLLVNPLFVLKDVGGVEVTAAESTSVRVKSSDDSNFEISSGSAGDRGKDSSSGTTDREKRQGLHNQDPSLVVNTWTGDFSSATARAWDVLRFEDGSVLDAVEQVG